MVLDKIKEEVKKMEGHDFLVLIGVLILILMTVRMTQTITVYEARSFFRESLINIAILLLVADLIIHVGRLEERVLEEEKRVLAEEAKITEEEKLIEEEMRRLGLWPEEGEGEEKKKAPRPKPKKTKKKPKKKKTKGRKSYYCTECKRNHYVDSKIGKRHKKYKVTKKA